MQASSKTLFKTAILLLGIMLAATVLVVAGKTQKADAISTSEWETVRSALNSYVGAQYQPGAEGEAGFVTDAATVKQYIDSNNNGIYLGEGDDVANAPILVDVLSGNTTWIPGTSVRGTWNTTSLTSGIVNQVAAEVNQHEAAGFSTNVVVYCATGHTEAPVTGGYGAIAQAGGLGGSTPPKVLAFKWGRNGWVNTARTYNNALAVGPAAGNSTYALDTQPDAACNGKTGAELVRCVAERAASAAGGNVSNGVNPAGLPLQLANTQPVDVRTGGPASTIAAVGTGNAAISVPIDSLFGPGLVNLNPSSPKKLTFASRTQHLGGIAAMGAEMLGYDSQFLQWGMPNWNKNMDEKWVSSGVSYPLVNTAIDTTAPTVTSVDIAGTTSTSADIHRAAGEPATMKVEYGTAPGVYTDTYNNTVLNAHKTVTLAGLNPGTTYYFRVTSYDGMANGTASAEQSFTTPPLPDTESPVVTYTGPTGTIGDSSPTITGIATDNIAVEMVSLSLNSSAPITCTVDGSGNVTCPTSGLADGDYTAEITASDAAGNSGSATGSFTVSTCTAGKPSLSLGAPSAFWASYADYTAKQLSVTWTVSNTGSTDASAVQIDSSNATYAPITTMTTMPAVIGSVDAGLSGGTVVKYQLPGYGPGFRVVNTGSATDCAANGYTYP